MTRQRSDDMAERWLVGALLISRQDDIIAADHLGELETVDIVDERMQAVVQAALNLRDAGLVVDCVAVAEELERTGRISPAWPSTKECLDELLQLMDETPPVWHVAEWSQRIQSAAVKRRAVTTAKNLLADLNNPAADAEDIAATAQHVAELALKGKHKRPRPEILLMNVADVEPKDVTWLWPNRIPAGKLTLLCGDPGLGKSHLTMDIAARVSNGWRWPDDPATAPPGKVLIFSAEDDIADTIRPRLDRAGADVSQVFCLESVKTTDARTGKPRHAAFSLSEHVPLLADAVKRLGNVKLIIIDPVSSYTGTTDSHKNAEVRTMLAPLVDLAEAHGFAILAVTHLSKGAGGKAVYRATGSLAFAAAARAVWMLAKDLDDPQRRLLLPVKCNIAPELSGLAFAIQSDSGGSFVAWEADPVPMTADGYLADESKRQTKGSEPDDSALAEAVEFLKEQLKSGPVLSSELESAGKAHDISAASLRRAKKQLHCKADKRNSDGKWMVLLPDQTIRDDKVLKQGAHTSHLEQDEQVERLEHVVTGDSDGQGAQDVQGAQESQVGIDERVAPLKSNRKKKTSAH